LYFKEYDCNRKTACTGNVNMLSLLGLNDANLRMIEDRFNSSITVRGDNVIIKGLRRKSKQLKKYLKK